MSSAPEQYIDHSSSNSVPLILPSDVRILKLLFSAIVPMIIEHQKVMERLESPEAQGSATSRDSDVSSSPHLIVLSPISLSERPAVSSQAMTLQSIKRLDSGEGQSVTFLCSSDTNLSPLQSSSAPTHEDQEDAAGPSSLSDSAASNCSMSVEHAHDQSPSPSSHQYCVKLSPIFPLTNSAPEDAFENEIAVSTTSTVVLVLPRSHSPTTALRDSLARIGTSS